MKPIPSVLSLGAILALATLPAKAATYSDPAGDFTGGTPSLDLLSANVNNDGTTLTFTLTLAGDPTSTVWANYIVGIAHPAMASSGGNFNATGGWGLDVQMSAGGMDYVVASYPGYGGYDFKTWNGTGWNSGSGSASETTSTVTIPVSLSSLGLSAGDTIKFDVWTQSSGNTVLDALSDGTPRSWNSNPFDTGNNALSYTVVAVPEPTSLALLGLAGVVLMHWRGRRS